MRDNGWPVTFSIGAVTFDAAPESVDALLQSTDQEQYRAKKAGKDRIVYAHAAAAA